MPTTTPPTPPSPSNTSDFHNLTSESGGQSTTAQYPKVTAVYKTISSSGLQLTADIFGSPVSSSSTASPTLRPTILWIHGGGLIFGTKQWIPKEQLDRYLQQNYIVVAIDHRLAPQTKVPDIVQDICDAWDWMTCSDAASTYGMDPKHMAIVGHSAGGYLALLLAALLTCRDNSKQNQDSLGTTTSGTSSRILPVVKSPYTPQAVVSVYGFADITGPWVAQPNHGFQPNLPHITRAAALASVGGENAPEVASDPSPDFDPNGRPKFFFYTKKNGTWIEDCCGVAMRQDNIDWFASYEPIKYLTAGSVATANNKYPPTLLVHGDLDNDVPIQQSLDVYEALQSSGAGATVEFIRNSDWPHLFDQDASDPTVRDFLDRLIVFLQKYI